MAICNDCNGRGCALCAAGTAGPAAAWTDRDAKAAAGRLLRAQRRGDEVTMTRIWRGLSPEQRAHVRQVVGEELTRRANGR